MTDLSRSLLAAAREGLAPDAATMARVRAKVATTVAAPAAPATGATGGSSSIALKLGALLIIVGAAATTIIATHDRAPAPSAPRVAVPAATEADEPPPVVQVAAPEAAPIAPRPTARHAEAATPMIGPLPAPEAAPPEPASLSREVELIDLAMVSLRKGAPRAALEAIRVFDRETFARGQMAEEAAAIEIEARCRLREDVTERLAKFDRKWPSSAQRERLQTACFSR